MVRSMMTGRRAFLRVGVLGGGASLLAMALPARSARAAATDALLLSCMDYRLTNETERYMSGRGLRNKYDHVILAGAPSERSPTSTRPGIRRSGSTWRWPSSCTRSRR